MIINVPALTGAETGLPVTLRAALDCAADLARAEKSAATQRAYKSDFAIFSAWCVAQGLCALPADPAAVAAFIAAPGGRSARRQQRRPQRLRTRCLPWSPETAAILLASVTVP